MQMETRIIKIQCSYTKRKGSPHYPDVHSYDYTGIKNQNPLLVVRMTNSCKEQELLLGETKDYYVNDLIIIAKALKDPAQVFEPKIRSRK